ncbi:MAG: DUF1963 domain-containing protein [Pseudomonadota bacterium]
MRQTVALAANILLFAYVLDAVLTFLDIMFGVNSISVLHSSRSLVANTVMLLAALWLVALVLCGDLVKGWLLFWLAISVYWLNSGGQPVGFFFEDPRDPRQMWVLMGLQLLIATVSMIRVRLSYGKWWITQAVPASLETRFFGWLGRFLGRAFTILLLWLVYQPFGLMTVLEHSTGGYMSFTWDGIEMRDVEFVHASGDSVRLIGIMHFGDPLVYQELLESFEKPRSIILEEGVTDRDGLISTGSTSKQRRDSAGVIVWQPGMDEVRGAVRVEDERKSHPWVSVKNADVDASELSPEMLEWLRKFATLRQRSATNPMETLLQLSALSTQMSDIGLEYIVYGRNTRLLEHLEAVRGDFDYVVVPWGAMHMPGIEASLIQLGFAPMQQDQRWTLLKWTTLFESLSGNSKPKERSLTDAQLHAYAQRSSEAMLLTQRAALELVPVSDTGVQRGQTAQSASNLSLDNGGLAAAMPATKSVGVMGGLPTRLEGENWPRNTKTGTPLSFLLEINRDEKHAAFFGDIKRLRLFVDYSAFWGGNEEGTYAVLIDRVGDPERMEIGWTGEELDALAAEFGPLQEDYGARLSWSGNRLVARAVEMVDRELMPFEPDQVDRETMLTWFDISDEAMEAFADDHGALLIDFESSFLGGYPQWIQFPDDAGDLPFFLQFAPLGEMMWGDGGIFYLYLDPEDPSRVVLLGQMS